VGDTTISWTMGDDGALGKTWNPIRGCSRVSEGCRHCYAERVAVRFCGAGQPYEGLADRERGRWTGEVRIVPEHLADPLRWKKPRRIFVDSMSDLFHERLSNEQIAAVFGIMAAASQHTLQVLTKRARRMREWFEWVTRQGEDDGNEWTTCLRETGTWLTGQGDHRLAEMLVEDGIARDGAFPSREEWPLPNVWLGVSVENQEAADERIPELLATPAAVRFLSCEPLIDDVSLWAFLKTPLRDNALGILEAERNNAPPSTTPGIDWCIAGCESGPGARPCDIAWLRSLRDQCAAAGVPFFLKQAREEWQLIEGPEDNSEIPIVVEGDGSKRKAGDVIELPYLDGVQHRAFPR
jgi:protein gp37